MKGREKVTESEPMANGNRGGFLLTRRTAVDWGRRSDGDVRSPSGYTAAEWVTTKRHEHD